MAFAHNLSCKCTKSELDLFSVPATQTSVERSNWVEYHPITVLGEGAPIEFDIGGSGEDYIDFNNTLLHVKAKIVQNDGNNLAVDAAVAPVNLFLHSLFSQVDVSLNGTLITSSTNTYPYRAMLETLLSYPPDALRSQLTGSLFYQDDASLMDSREVRPDHADTANKGFLYRRSVSANSAIIDMIGRLHCDIFFQPRYMLNEMNLKIKLVRAPKTFCLMGADSKVLITHASMLVRKVKLMPSTFLAHAKQLEQSTAKYPIRRVVCKSFTVPEGYRDVNHEKLFSGQLPTRMVVGMVTNRAFNGDLEDNPFNFQHFHVTELGLYLDGQQQQLKPMEMNYATREYIRAYTNMFAGTGKLCGDQGLIVSRSMFPNGYALYVFDLSADLGEDDHFNLIREGNVRLTIKFGEALETTISVIAYAEFENIIEVDRARNVVFDFSA